eukprot:COSAG02_NODE_42130_length_387_cov_1.076389_1_plen_115_part_10
MYYSVGVSCCISQWDLSTILCCTVLYWGHNDHTMGNNEQWWLCIRAAAGDKKDVLELLGQGATPNGEGIKEYAGSTPLGCAAGSRHWQGEKHPFGHVCDPLGCMGALLDAGAEPD